MKKGDSFPVAPSERLKGMVEYTGERRRPKKGEWYLSGAVIEGYRAPGNLSQAFHIGRLLKGKE